MIDYIFICGRGIRHHVRASELDAAFQYANTELRQGSSWSLYWVETSSLTYELKDRP